jgi:hypothetical protein
MFLDARRYVGQIFITRSAPPSVFICHGCQNDSTRANNCRPTLRCRFAVQVSTPDELREMKEVFSGFFAKVEHQKDSITIGVNIRVSSNKSESEGIVIEVSGALQTGP